MNIKKIYIMVLIIFIALFVVVKINGYYCSKHFIFNQESVIDGRYYLVDKDLNSRTEVTKAQWYLTNMEYFLFLIVGVGFQILTFYCIVRYGIPYFYYRKWEQNQ